MRIIDCVQGSAEWHRARCGIPTASEAHLVITPKTGKLSASAPRYAYRLIAERLLNRPVQDLDGLQYIERGKEMEPQAVRQYEFENDVETEPVGFVLSDDGLIGASPDRLIVGRPAGLEIKSPAAHTQIQYLLEGHDEKYRPQVNMQMLVAEFEYVDWYSFHPRCPPVLIRTPRDEPYIRLMRSALDEFNDRLAAMLERARSLGIFQAYEDVATPAEAEYAEELEWGDT
jgi:hypothetical protein